MASLQSQPPKKKTKKAKRLPRVHSEQLKRLDSLPWSSSLPDNNDDPFSLLAGSNELEGGFLSLEEIDESAYALEIPKSKRGNLKEKQQKEVKSKKRKRKEGDNIGDNEAGNEGSGEEAEGRSEDEVEEEEVKSKKKNKQKKKKSEKVKKTSEEIVETVAVTNGKNNVEGDLVDEAEFFAWNELRLHPLLMKSIYRLKFKKPTPIQKACIPAAAHQGKDVIGAAETGSGKTLAFGLPILQRLLEEREKADNLLTENGNADDKIASAGLLRALIITPTRELALQVTDHLKEVAKGTNIRVVPIVGGMSTEKQERLLKARPEIVVGTPGRLWELMSGGEIHLVEVCMIKEESRGKS